MSEKHTHPGAGPSNKDAEKAAQQAAEAQAKRAKAEAEAEAKQAARRAEEEEEKAHEAERAEHAAEKETGETPSEHEERAEKAKEPEGEEAADAEEPEAEAEEPEDEADDDVEVVEDDYVAKAKPELDEARQQALRVRSEKKARQPNWRRQEWFRYKKLGGRKAPWRAPRGMHSKMRRHYKFRPNVVSIGFRGPVAARGLHPSGFEEVLVHRPEDLDGVDPKTQAARVGGTVGGRKAERIQEEADKLGIRILNRRS